MERRRYQLLPLVVSVLSLISCGGGGSAGPDSIPSNTQPAAGFARITGQVLDGNNAPVAGAEVSLPFGKAQAWTGKTDAGGNYSFDARASDFANVKPVAMIISKDGYLPRTVYYASIVAGAGYTFKSDAQTASVPLGANQVVPTTGLWHLGDDNFSGSINSQLQMSSVGKLVDFPLANWSAAQATAYKTARIQLVARGVQCSGTTFGLATIANGGISRYYPAGKSDANGNFTNYDFSLDVTGFPVGAAIRFVAISGACSTTDADDFEFTQVIVTFNG